MIDGADAPPRLVSNNPPTPVKPDRNRDEKGAQTNRALRPNPDAAFNSLNKSG